MSIDTLNVSHIERDKGHVVAIRCRGCGATIQSMVEYDHPDLTKQRVLKDGTVLRQVHVVLRPNTRYTQITMELSNGDRHETHCCVACKPRFLNDKDELQALMENDIQEQLVNEGLEPALGALFKSRRVVGV